MTDVDHLVERVLQAAGSTVVVVGDVLLDRWWAGPADRISREAPAPVVQVTTRTDVAGGAANTAVNLAALGARVRIVGAVGQDDAGDRLVGLLQAAGVDTAGLVRAPGLATTAKTRISGGGQVLVRMDEGDVLTDDARDLVAAGLPEALAGADAVLVCEYGLGATTGAVREALAVADRPEVLVVDAHDLAPWALLAPTAVTPNARETQQLLGASLGTDRAAGAIAAKAALFERTGASGVIVTLDRDGTVAVQGDDDARCARALEQRGLRGDLSLIHI